MWKDICSFDLSIWDIFFCNQKNQKFRDPDPLVLRLRTSRNSQIALQSVEFRQLASDFHQIRLPWVFFRSNGYFYCLQKPIEAVFSPFRKKPVAKEVTFSLLVFCVNSKCSQNKSKLNYKNKNLMWRKPHKRLYCKSRWSECQHFIACQWRLTPEPQRKGIPKGSPFGAFWHFWASKSAYSS